jgi:type I restriction enzyme S subunit
MKASLDSARHNPEYVYYYFSSPQGQKQIHVSAIQTGVPHTNLGICKKYIFPAPTIVEQSRISSVLTDIDCHLESLDRLLEKKRQIKQAAMQELLTGKRRLPGFEGEWEEVQLGNIASIRNARVVASSMPPDTKCIELDCIDQGTGRLLTSSYATGAGTKYTFKRRDVLFGRLRAYLRKFWLASFDGICSTEIWPLIARDNRLSAGFLHLLVQSNSFVDAAGVSYGTHMPRSDWSVLRKFQLKLPPVDEQVAIATLLSDMDAELAALEARRDKTRALKQAMMQELLTGRIRLR